MQKREEWSVNPLFNQDTGQTSLTPQVYAVPRDPKGKLIVTIEYEGAGMEKLANNLAEWFDIKEDV